MTVTMIETNHHLTQREPDGEFYRSRCGLYNPSEEEQTCVPLRYERAELREEVA